jgi:hypothetical protein
MPRSAKPDRDILEVQQSRPWARRALATGAAASPNASTGYEKTLEHRSESASAFFDTRYCPRRSTKPKACGFDAEPSRGPNPRGFHRMGKPARTSSTP